jgi:hypothetical protein
VFFETNSIYSWRKNRSSIPARNSFLWKMAAVEQAQASMSDVHVIP